MASGHDKEGEERVTLCDGLQATIRLIRPDDAVRLQALMRRLSPDTVYQRSRLPLRELPAEYARRLAEVDHLSQTAIVATRENEAGEVEIMGVARYALTDDRRVPTGEVAVVVEDSCQGLGLGRLLLERLIERARSLGVRKLVACVHYQNAAVLSALHRTQLPVSMAKEPGGGEILVELVIAPS